MMDISQELENLKTSFRGYDKEAVLEFVRQLLLENEKEKKKENAALVEQNAKLQRSLKASEEKLSLMNEQYQELSKQMEQLTASLNQGKGHSKEAEKGLELILGKAEEIGGFLIKTKEDAEAERERLIADGEQQRNALIEAGEKEKERIVEAANRQSEFLLTESRQSYEDAVHRASQLRQELDAFREKILPLLSWADEVFMETEDEPATLEKILDDLDQDQKKAMAEEDALDAALLESASDNTKKEENKS